MWHVVDVLYLTPHVDGCMLLPHSNHTVMVLMFNMIFILKFITADHSNHSW
jgi:hypothetical protein